MFLSVFDLFKIGIGPSSSHTMGPMTAAARFRGELDGLDPSAVRRLRCTLYGSLAFTGKGHGTDRAIVLGLVGHRPETIDPDVVAAEVERVQTDRRVPAPAGWAEPRGQIAFDPAEDLIFNFDAPLPAHPNGLSLEALGENGQVVLRRAYYSIGGGFVVDDEELLREQAEAEGDASESKLQVGCPYPFGNAEQMLRMAQESGLSLVEMKRANELARCREEELDRGLDEVWSAMNACINRGLREDGELPGGLSVKRRAKELGKSLGVTEGVRKTDPYALNEWLSLYAMAVNEENAAGAKVVTAPTNGAAGVVPAVLRCYLDLHPEVDARCARDYLLVAAAIGGLIKHNASISGAEVGCQGEVGSASAMAAAGLTAIRGGTAEQIENAAEIALEHHLGMTCDPVGGLVQVPCIERNGFGAVKAVTASSLALRGDGAHHISLDRCVETMRLTGLDLSDKYKETSRGGLAVTHPAC